MMDKRMVTSLLKVVQGPPDRTEYPASALLRRFVEESGIGITQGNKVRFTPAHKERIRAWLEADGIDPATPLDAWADRGRFEAMALGPDEKWAGVAVRAQRIAFKTLAGHPLTIGSQPIYLPRLANLEWDVDEALKSLRHDRVIVVENWESFERIDELQVDMDPAGISPLVIWRGGGQRATVGAVLAFLRAYGRPVWSAPDYDPAGLAIAEGLPHLAGVLAPPDDVLRTLLEASRLDERYRQQLPGAQAVLERTTNPDVQRLWRLVRAAGKALPQERLCMGAGCEMG